MAELGHSGDLQVLDNREFGYAKFIGTDRWEPDIVGGGWAPIGDSLPRAPSSSTRTAA